jgi:hypothetical protein
VLVIAGGALFAFGLASIDQNRVQEKNPPAHQPAGSQGHTYRGTHHQSTMLES